MEGKERLFYGLGLLAFAVAKADGHVDPEERQKLHDIVSQDSACKDPAIDISEIIFHILDKHDSFSQDLLYDLAMKEFKIAENFMEDDMYSDFPAVLEKVARAFDPITAEEHEIILKFRKDLGEVS